MPAGSSTVPHYTTWPFDKATDVKSLAGLAQCKAASNPDIRSSCELSSRCHEIDCFAFRSVKIHRAAVHTGLRGSTSIAVLLLVAGLGATCMHSACGKRSFGTCLPSFTVPGEVTPRLENLDRLRLKSSWDHRSSKSFQSCKCCRRSVAA